MSRRARRGPWGGGLVFLAACAGKGDPDFGDADTAPGDGGGEDTGDPAVTTTTWAGGTDWIAGAGAPLGWTEPAFDDQGWEAATSPSLGACDRQFDPFLLDRALEWWEVEGTQSVWSGADEQAVALRRTFSIPDDVEVWDARLTVLADDDFRLWVNGALVATERDQQGGPDTQLDLSALLTAGSNTLALQVEDRDPDGCRAVWVSAGLRYGVPNEKKEIPTEGPASLLLASDADWTVYAPPALAWLEGWWSPEHEGPAWTEAAVAAPTDCGVALAEAVGGSLGWWQDPATIPLWAAGDPQEAWLFTELTVDPEAVVVEARLSLLADDDHALYLNGDALEIDEDLLPGSLRDYDLTERLRPGANQLAIRAEDVDPACRAVLVSAGMRTKPGLGAPELRRSRRADRASG
jgi:hypothetical protein